VLLSVGFLSAGVKELPGNAGLFDMALALEWIRDYISFFGGTPDRITVFGQGTGASSAVLLALSQITQGNAEEVSY
jgi:carboxylesterase type B